MPKEETHFKPGQSGNPAVFGRSGLFRCPGLDEGGFEIAERCLGLELLRGLEEIDPHHLGELLP